MYTTQKVVRSTMGAIFRVNVIESENLKDTIKEIKKHKFNVISTSLDTDKSLYDIELNKSAIIVGNEAKWSFKRNSRIIRYKNNYTNAWKTESLNASVATGVVLYEYVRQKICK